MKLLRTACLWLVLALRCLPSVAQELPDLTEDARATLLGHVDTLELRVLTFPAHAKPGLQGVLLYVPDLLIEPSARMKLGGDIWAHVRVPAEAGAVIVELAAISGVFRRAAKYYSERMVAAPDTPPPPACAAPAGDRPAVAAASRPGLRLSFGSSDAYWHSSYEVDLPWDAGAQQLLEYMQRALQDADGAIIASLRATMADPAPLPLTYLGSFTTLRNTGEHTYLDELRLWQHVDGLYGLILRQHGLIGDTPVELDRVVLGGIEASGELLAYGAVLGFDGKLSGDRIEGKTSDGQSMVLERGSRLDFLVPEMPMATVGELDAWIDALAAGGRFVVHTEP